MHTSASICCNIANLLSTFNEALKVGNGCMVYGLVRDEYISLNEQMLWSGALNTSWNNLTAKNYLPLVRAAALGDEYNKPDTLESL